MASYTIVAPGHPPGPNDRLHWQARRRLEKPLRDAVIAQARAQAPRVPASMCRVTCTLVYPSRRYKDIDNATASLKSLVDALTYGGVLLDDSPAHMTLEVRQEKGSGREVVIVVEEVEA